MFLMVRTGYTYTFSVYFYTFRLVFSSISHCILHHFALHFAPFCLAFSIKTHYVLHHIAMRLAAYCTIFSDKWPKNQCKWWLLDINIHFASICNYTLFAPKPTLARIDFLRQGWRLVNKKGTHNVKFITKN